MIVFLLYTCTGELSDLFRAELYIVSWEIVRTFLNHRCKKKKKKIYPAKIVRSNIADSFCCITYRRIICNKKIRLIFLQNFWQNMLTTLLPAVFDINLTISFCVCEFGKLDSEEINIVFSQINSLKCWEWFQNILRWKK